MKSITFSEQENWKTTIRIRKDGYINIEHKSKLYPRNSHSIQLSPNEIEKLEDLMYRRKYSIEYLYYSDVWYK